LKDDEIARLLIEEKPPPEGWEGKLALRPKQNSAFRQRELTVKSASGNAFRIVIRQSAFNQDDFSIILMFKDSDGAEYRLSRFNGRHPSEHTNKVEKRQKKLNATFRNTYHIHRATERYQLAGFELDGYAEPTTAYNSFDSALRAFLNFYKFTHSADKLPLLDPLGGG
jgi:hypothetical protein